MAAEVAEMAPDFFLQVDDRENTVALEEYTTVAVVLEGPDGVL